LQIYNLTANKVFTSNILPPPAFGLQLDGRPVVGPEVVRSALCDLLQAIRSIALAALCGRRRVSL